MILIDAVLIHDSGGHARRYPIYLFNELGSLLRDRTLDVKGLCFMVAYGVCL